MTKAIDDLYEIKVEVVDGVLHCELTASLQPGSRVIWTLHRGDFDPRRASKPVVSGAKWKVVLPDMSYGFAVRAVVEGTTYDSKWVQYFSAESVDRYRVWRDSLETSTAQSLPTLELFLYEEPFQSFAMVCHDDDLPRERLASLAARHGLEVESTSGVRWQSLTVLSARGSQADARGTRYVFSGITRDSDRLLFGPEDVVAHVDDVRELRDAIGEFHMLSWEQSRISLEHDYIGQGHLFYYEADGIFAAANGVHLLALVLKSIGVRLVIDEPRAVVKFFSTSYPFEFQHGPSTDFRGIKRLSSYERIEISPDGAQLVKTEMWRDDHDVPLSDTDYEVLLAAAATEVVDNVNVAINHERFQNVVVELSAGLDSRMIYSALTRLPPSSKVKIATRRGPEEVVAAKINNLYHYPWDNLARHHSFDCDGASGALPASTHSVFMDGYYIESMFKERVNYREPTLLLTGHGGEAFSRVMSVEGYFARDFAGRIVEPAGDVGEVLKNVIRYVGNHQVWLEAGERYFPQVLEESLAQSPSRVFAKRFEDLYVSERNPYVCGSVYRGALSAPQWRPLHSKSLFRLRSLWFQRRQDYRLQFDLIRLLNPLVSEAPYIKPVEIARKEEFHTYRPPFDLSSAIDFSSDLTALRQARAEAEACATWSPDRDAVDKTTRAAREYEEDAASFLDPLAVVLTLAPELEELGLPLFTYVERVVSRENPRSFSKRHNIRNKLHILAQEILLARE